MVRPRYLLAVPAVAIALWSPGATHALGAESASRAKPRVDDASKTDRKRAKRLKDACRERGRRAKSRRRRARRLELCGSSGGQARADFNGDGVTDLVVGVPNETVGAVSRAGAIHVIYGSSAGLTATGNQFFHQDSAGILDTAEADDRFGSALAAGDFDGDGFSDLAVGVPLENLGAIADAGAVNVIYGSPAGLADAGNQLWHQDSAGILDSAEAGDHFGEALVWGDFGRDRAADLAVGAREEGVGSNPEVQDAGAVNVIYGAAPVGVEGGLRVAGNQFIHQNSLGVLDAAEAGDRFGSALTAGDLDGSGKADLAVGARFEDVTAPGLQIGAVDAGAVQVFYSDGSSLALSDNQLWHQDSAGILGGSAESDAFGVAVVAGDFDGDRVSDLAVGSHDRVDGNGLAGAVNAIYGTRGSTGLAPAGNQLWHQNVDQIEDTAETADLFGSALAAGDFDGDARADLAVGVPRETFGAVGNAGLVNVIYAGPGGLAAADDQFWTQNNVGPDSPEVNDGFGSALSAWNFGQAPADLAIAVPGESLGSTEDAGAVHVLYGIPGTPGGLGIAGNQFWNQDSAGILDAAEPADAFGRALY